MWTCIDNEMGLKDCFIYAYEPADDPYEGEEGTIWSLNYFFFNKQLKRVAYLYIRGVPALSASHEIRKRSSSCYDIGANRRSRYLPGDRVDEVTGSDSDGVNRGLNDGEDDDDDDEDSDLMQGGSRSYDDYDDDVAARMELEL